jgi:hypothetical protein
MKDDENYKELTSDIRQIAKRMENLNRQAESEYAPLVNSVIQRKSKDSQEIERLLDGLLDFACDKQILNLYRKLCKYYYFINPESTARYITFYKEMWDEEELLFRSGYFKNTEIK